MTQSAQNKELEEEVCPQYCCRQRISSGEILPKGKEENKKTRMLDLEYAIECAGWRNTWSGSEAY